MLDIHALSSDLKLGQDGIWYSSDTQAVSYPSSGNDDDFAVEDGSFWFKHRNACIVAIVKSFPPENGGAIFDVGGGNGFVSVGLENAGFEVVLMEPGRSGATNAKRRGLRNVVCASTDTARLNLKSLPAVALFDVVEHIEDDLAFMRSIADLLRSAGRLYITVPAYSCLWSAADAATGHFRRYDLKQICNLLTTTGFSIEFSSYIFRPLPIPIFLLRTLPFRMGLSRQHNTRTDESRDHARTNLLDSMLHNEIENLSNKRPMRFGGSCLVVAKAPQK